MMLTVAEIETSLKPWQDLANGIVMQAAKDYMAALRKLKRFPQNPRAEAEITGIEKFFRSEWYSQLTEIDGERLMKMLKKEVGVK